jgi:hypothetical protein
VQTRSPNTRLVLNQESSRSAHRSRASPVVGVQLSTLGETSGRIGRGQKSSNKGVRIIHQRVTAFETISIPDSQIGSPSMDKK